MRVVMVEVGRNACEMELEDSLASMQHAVGGLIQAVYEPGGRNAALICNEEGKLLGLPLNRALRDEEGEIHVLHLRGTDRQRELHISYGRADCLLARTFCQAGILRQRRWSDHLRTGGGTVPIGCTLTAHRKRVPIGSLPAFWYVPSAGGTLLGLRYYSAAMICSQYAFS